MPELIFYKKVEKIKVTSVHFFCNFAPKFLLYGKTNPKISCSEHIGYGVNIADSGKGEELTFHDEIVLTLLLAQFLYLWK